MHGIAHGTLQGFLGPILSIAAPSMVPWRLLGEHYRLFMNLTPHRETGNIPQCSGQYFVRLASAI